MWRIADLSRTYGDFCVGPVTDMPWNAALTFGDTGHRDGATRLSVSFKSRARRYPQFRFGVLQRKWPKTL